MPRNRIAAIDIGTNSIHMIIVEQRGHSYRVIDKEKEMVQLGRGSLEGRPLTDAAIERGVETLRKMAAIAERWQVKEVVALATSAIREAPNRRRFISAAQKAAGFKIRVVSGEEEADYIYRAVRAALDFHGGTALVIDIGGGSLELIAGTADEVYLTASEPLGALRMAQMFELDEAASQDAVDACRAWARKRLKKTLNRISAIGFDFAVGTSGTIVTLSTIASSDAMTSGLRWLSRKQLGELIAELAPLSVDARAQRFTIDTKRAETILAGAIVLHEIMRKLEMDQIRACDAALREGIVEYVLDQPRDEPRPQQRGSVRRSSVLALADRSGVDRAHAAHVARLALRIFDQTEELHRFRTGSGSCSSTRCCSTRPGCTSPIRAITSTRTTSSAMPACAGSPPIRWRSWPTSRAITASRRRTTLTTTTHSCRRRKRSSCANSWRSCGSRTRSTGAAAGRCAMCTSTRRIIRFASASACAATRT